jgi:hypothetical protein
MGGIGSSIVVYSIYDVEGGKEKKKNQQERIPRALPFWPYRRDYNKQRTTHTRTHTQTTTELV